MSRFILNGLKLIPISFFGISFMFIFFSSFKCYLNEVISVTLISQYAPLGFRYSIEICTFSFTAETLLTIDKSQFTHNNLV